MRRPFLTADWGHLLLVNYEVPAACLAPLVPRGTTLDLVEGKAYASIVGFRMLGTRLLGVPIPFHRDFDEVNLRFYLRRGERRGVAFVKEIVPKRTLALVARIAYNERYVARPMRSEVTDARVAYAWREGGRVHRIGASPVGAWDHPAPGSHERFVVDHLWGYAAQRDGGTVEYEVDHPPWRVRAAREVETDVDFRAVYGAIGAHLDKPVSAFFAEGSAVAVARPIRISQSAPPPPREAPRAAA